jgi:hypothetical protein
MRRCDWCGGPFGLICHRHMGKRFCRKPCKAGHVQRRRQVRSARVLHWLRVLSLANAYTVRNTDGASGIGLPQPDLAFIPIASESPPLRRRVQSLAKSHNY